MGKQVELAVALKRTNQGAPNIPWNMQDSTEESNPRGDNFFLPWKAKNFWGTNTDHSGVNRVPDGPKGRIRQVEFSSCMAGQNFWGSH